MPVSSHNVGRNCSVSLRGVERSSTTFDGVRWRSTERRVANRSACPHSGAWKIAPRSPQRTSLPSPPRHLDKYSSKRTRCYAGFDCRGETRPASSPDGRKTSKSPIRTVSPPPPLTARLGDAPRSRSVLWRAHPKRHSLAKCRPHRLDRLVDRRTAPPRPAGQLSLVRSDDRRESMAARVDRPAITACCAAAPSLGGATGLAPVDRGWFIVCAAAGSLCGAGIGASGGGRDRSRSMRGSLTPLPTSLAASGWSTGRGQIRARVARPLTGLRARAPGALL